MNSHQATEGKLDEENNLQPIEEKTDFCLEDVTVEFIKENYDDYSSNAAASKKLCINKKPASITQPASGYKLILPRKEETTIVFKESPKRPSSFQRDPDKDQLSAWRHSLQLHGQVCCPLPDCQVSYCSLRGLILHYQTCSGKRDDSEAVKCKICRKFVSCRISLAHHNRLLHRGKPMKAVDTFIESQHRINNKRQNQVDGGELKITKSMRQIRKPMRYRDTTEEDEESKLEEKYANFRSPLTAARGQKFEVTATATVTSETPGSGIEELQKSTFLYKMGLARKSSDPSCMYLEIALADNEDGTSDVGKRIPSALEAHIQLCGGAEDEKKLSEIDSFMDTSKKQWKSTATKPEVPIGEDGQPVRRKRGRPRKIRPGEEATLQPQTALSSVHIPTSKRGRKRRKLNKSDQNKTNEATVNSEDYTEDEQKIILRQTFKKFGKLVCPREGCRKPLISLPGYFYHIKNCTKGVAVPTKQIDRTVADTSADVQNNGLKNDKVFLERDKKEFLERTLKQCGKLLCPNESCPKSFLSIYGYMQHIGHCKPEGVANGVSCGVCSSVFSTLEIFKNHAYEFHNGMARVAGDTRPFGETEQNDAWQKTLRFWGQLVCPKCKKTCTSLLGFKSHLRDCQDTADRVFCGVCAAVFSNLETFETHAYEFHNGEALVAGGMRPFSETEKHDKWRKTLEKGFHLVCPICGKMLTSLAGFKYHLLGCVANEEPIRCGVCDVKIQCIEFPDHAISAHNGLARPSIEVQTFTVEEKNEVLKKTLILRGKLQCFEEGCLAEFRNIKKYLKHSAICKTEGVAIVCGVCKSQFPAELQFNQHAMSQHNGLARPDGQEQTFTDEEELAALRNSMKYVRKLRCLRTECGKTFISLGGYQYHVKHCGLQGNFLDCTVCGKKLRELSMPYHMRQAHPPSPPPRPKEQQEEVVVETNAAGQPRRRAAKRAREKVKEIARGYFIEDDFPNTQKDQQKREIPDDDFNAVDHLPSEAIKYTKPTPVHVTKTLFAEWKAELDEKGKIVCKNQDCLEESSSPWQMKAHYTHCPYSPFDKGYTCQCGMKTHTEAAMLTHIETHMEDSNADDSDYEINDEESSGKQRSKYDKLPLPNYRGGNDLEPFAEALCWTLEFYQKHYQDKLFVDWRPLLSWWKELDGWEKGQYLPATKQSVNFQTVDTCENSGELPTNWKQLQLFDTANEEPTKSIFFAGGPVWGLAWCPTPLHKVATQYLAISCHPSMDDKIRSDRIHSCSGTIQIWKTSDGLIHSRSSLSASLQLIIAHDFGYIWNMEWCPSGCWDDENASVEEGRMPSLGLLAAACSNGTISIFSVPHPLLVPKCSESPVFKVNPTVVLQTNPVLSPSSQNNQNSPCISLSWTRSEGHNLLAGGFADGRVAMWDLKTRSPLLCIVTPEQQNILGPFHIFQAHMSTVHDVVWCPNHGGRFLATIGLDRQVHFWSTNDLSLPSNSYNRGRLLKLQWSPHWCGVFPAQDDCYNLWRNYMGFLDSGYSGFGGRSLNAHNGCVWDVSVNDWLNCTASCDSSGEVIGFVMCQMLQNLSKLKHFCKRRFPIYRIKLEELKDGDDKGNTDKERTNSKQVRSEDASEERPIATDKVLGATEPANSQADLSATVTESSNDSEDRAQTDNTANDATAPPQTDLEANLKGLHHAKTKNGTKRSSYTAMPNTYKEAASKFGVIFYDSPMGYPRSIPQSEVKRLSTPTSMNETRPDAFPLASINRAAWNPNLGCHTILATGGHSGLVRIHCIEWLNRTAVDRRKTKVQAIDNSVQEVKETTELVEKETTADSLGKLCAERPCNTESETTTSEFDVNSEHSIQDKSLITILVVRKRNKLNDDSQQSRTIEMDESNR